jgi:hypothetical protein
MLFNKKIGAREESFTINHFKRLLLNYIISNNISFKAIMLQSDRIVVVVKSLHWNLELKPGFVRLHTR